MLNKRDLILFGLVFLVMQALINMGVFVTYQQMVAYAAPITDITKIEQALIRIEKKLDTYMLR